MDSTINYTILDANNLTKTVDNQMQLLKENGFSEETNANLKAALQNLELKEAAQSTAVKESQKKTAEQDQVVTGVYALIKRVRNAVRSAYEDNQAMIAQFKANEQIPNSVKNISSLCKYLHPLVVKENALLLKNGLMQNDIDELGTASGRILAADSEQESAKKLQQAATVIRNDAAKEVSKHMKKIRNFIKARFDKRPEIAVLFDPIPKGRGGSNGEEETTKEGVAKPSETKT